MKTGAAFNQQHDYTPSVSNVKGICRNICRNILPLKMSSSFKWLMKRYKLKAVG